MTEDRAEFELREIALEAGAFDADTLAIGARAGRLATAAERARVAEREPAWMAAFDDARDSILNDRGQLAEMCLTGEQTNAVLSILDDAFMPHLKRGAAAAGEDLIYG